MIGGIVEPGLASAFKAMGKNIDEQSAGQQKKN